MPDGKYLTFNGNPYHQSSQLCKITDIQFIINNYGALRCIQGSFYIPDYVSSTQSVNLGVYPYFILCAPYYGSYNMDYSSTPRSPQLMTAVFRDFQASTETSYHSCHIIITTSGFTYI